MNNTKQETKNEKFNRLATNRTNAVIKSLKILGNCSNKNLYDYSESDVNKIFREIESCTKDIKAQFKYKDKIEKFKL